MLRDDDRQEDAELYYEFVGLKRVEVVLRQLQPGPRGLFTLHKINNMSGCTGRGGLVYRNAGRCPLKGGRLAAIIYN